VLDSISVADVVDSDSAVLVEGVVGNCPLAVPFEVEGDHSLFVPSAQVFLDLNVGHGFGWVLLKVGGG